MLQIVEVLNLYISVGLAMLSTIIVVGATCTAHPVENGGSNFVDKNFLFGVGG